MKKVTFLAIVGIALLTTACAGRATPAQSAAAGLRPANQLRPNGFFQNGVSSNSGTLGAATLDDVEAVRGQLVRR